MNGNFVINQLLFFKNNYYRSLSLSLKHTSARAHTHKPWASPRSLSIVTRFWKIVPRPGFLLTCFLCFAKIGGLGEVKGLARWGCGGSVVFVIIIFFFMITSGKQILGMEKHWKIIFENNFSKNLEIFFPKIGTKETLSCSFL